MSKRVLMITRPYYPNNATGSHRPTKLAKYLPRAGWEPTVVSADWTRDNSQGYYDRDLAALPDVCRTVRVAYRVAHTLPGRALERVARRLWPYHAPFQLLRAMRKAALELAATEKFDAVWSTFYPGLDHTVAWRVRREFGMPWVADFRDLPDQTYDTPAGRRCVRAERAVCRHASALATVSEDLKEILQRRYDLPVHVIPNGFDPEDFPPPPPGPTEKFTIRFFGRLYAYRNPRPLFEALDLARRSGWIENWQDVRVEFFGTGAENVRKHLAGFACADVVAVRDRVERAEMIPLQQAASLLLMLKSQEAGSIPAKLFEYLGSQRPILNLPGDGDIVDRILHTTAAGRSIADPQEVARAIAAHYRQWKATGRTEYKVVPEEVRVYHRDQQARRLGELLDGLVGRG